MTAPSKTPAFTRAEVARLAALDLWDLRQPAKARRTVRRLLAAYMREKAAAEAAEAVLPDIVAALRDLGACANPRCRDCPRVLTRAEAALAACRAASTDATT